MEQRDFASLDPTQDRLRRELLLEGKTYAYKAGESIASPDSACTLEEAAVALACSHRDISFSVVAKAKIGSVWENLEAPKSLYKRLFREALTGVTLWRLIELLRSIDDALRRGQKSTKSSREKMIAVHGNRFVAHQVFIRLNLQETQQAACDMKTLKKEAETMAVTLLPQIASAVQAEFPSAYLQSLFKNSTKCSKVSKRLEMLTAKKKA